MSDEPKIRQYCGFPLFAEWANAGAQLSAWDNAVEQAPKPNSVSEPHLASALRIVRRAAAIDTGAIEALYGVDRGFTLTVAMQGAVWQAALDAKPDKARSLIQAQLDAYERLLDIINGPWPITEAVVRELHRQVCENQDTYIVETNAGRQEHELPKGEYKQQPNNVITGDGTVFQYCPPERVSSEMHSFVEIVRSEEFNRAHPVLQASWAHYAFILIHPFADGNGRVARLLASLFMCKGASIPLLVFADERGEYFGTLREADAGRPVPFIEFTAHCGQNAFYLVDASLQAARAPEPEESLQRLRRAYYTQTGLTYEDLDGRASGLLKIVQAALTAKLQAVQQAGAPFKNISWTTSDKPMFEPSNRSMRGPKGFASFQYGIQTKPPLLVNVSGWLQLEMPRDGAMVDEFQVRWHRLTTRPPETVLTARLQELLNPDSPRLRMQIELSVEYISRQILADVAQQAEDQRQKI